MSARDSAAPAGPGNNQAGGLGNGGIGGGFGGGAYGGGGGYGAGGGINGGYSNRTGLTTGNKMYGNSAYGPSGGMAQAYGTRDYASLNRAGMGPTVGSYGNFQTPQGQPMYGSSPVQGQSFNGMNMGQALSQANRAQAAWQAAQAAHPQVGGLLDPSQGNVQPTSGGIVPNGYNPVQPPPPVNPLVDVQPGLPTLPNYPDAPAVNHFGPRPYDGGYTSMLKNNSFANNPQYGYTGGYNGLGNYGGVPR